MAEVKIRLQSNYRKVKADIVHISPALKQVLFEAAVYYFG